ncbi:hypothetical protein BGW36DRAFT_429846 [Talaromyces proteolyticus]|uniref:Uncharacterized protein n=1 Tax=Talaromyces proteolyticus TaxID=1131652 RepID=A0AAD4KL55_9EURO|nr:uncharacterized protein BGW36DRAFT_429846 [Talaromyces proteolyticus]KAH8693814.1 hypothetical protein BGW36DRAFT_429846 [Talaromyces proteolyticus]
MPDLELVSAPIGAPSLDRPLFKAHKSLPRRRDIESKSYTIDMTFPTDTDHEKSNGAAAVSITPSLPLTPPNQIPEDPNGGDSSHDQLSSPFSNGTATPVTGFSPPTPDITPPRVRDATPKARPPLFLASSMSSQAESFQTARENFSDENLTESGSPSTHSLVQRHRRKPTLKQSPLAIDVERPVTPPNRELEPEAFETPKAKENGCVKRKSNQKETTVTTSPSSLPRKRQPNGTRRQGNRVRSTAEKSPSKSQEPLPSGLDQSSEALALAKFGAEIGWDLTDHEQKLMDRVDSWRNSAGSFTSTIEARVIEPTPQKRRTLRHTEKRISLRSVSSPDPPSTNTSLDFNVGDSPHRLVHKSARISNRNRHSVASDMSVSNSATSGNPPKAEVIPVVVIPQRRSSLKSSAPPSRNQSVTRSQDLSHRNNSISRSKASDSLPRRRKRTMSDSLPSTGEHSRADSRGRDLTRPPIPPRSSSLSAPTSRSNSRTTSLTSESLRRHTEAMSLTLHPPMKEVTAAALPSPRIILPDEPKPSEQPGSPFLQFHIDDGERLRAPSLHFTQSSVVSSSPGPIEIREATTVSFFPHNNESLLLINPYVQTESRAVRALRDWDLEPSGKVSTPKQSTAAVNFDSPLRNPRTPPKPPVQALVSAPPVDDINPQIADAEVNQQRSNRFGRGLGSVRRALSARRYSDTPGPPLFRSLSTRSAKNRRAEKASDSQLHPFWRPRGFWDDFDDKDDGLVNPAPQPFNAPEEDTFISNSLGLPQKRVIFAGPLALARRLSKSRRSRHRLALRHQQSQSNLNLAMGIVRTGSPYQHRTVRPRSRLRVLMPLTALRDFQQRVRQARQMRARARLEARRERLKQSIGVKTLANPYSVGPFNNGNPYQQTSIASNGPIHRL